MPGLELPLTPDLRDEAFRRPGRWWHAEAGRVVCDLCPRRCALKDGDRGFCFVRQNVGGEMQLTTFGRSTGFCIDPIEKKPLNHFLPGTSVLSFGTAGCNLGCKFCQNWDISKSREVARLSERAFPEDIARAAKQLNCRSVAFTYNDPVVWAEYAIETAKACRDVGVKSVAVTAGYVTEEARGDFYEYIDAANVDLKAFSEEFYHKLTSSHIQPVLDTLRWLKAETDVWFEVTNLIIPGANDDPGELSRMCDWLLDAVGDEVPVHFTAFHPDYKLTDRPRTPPGTLFAARQAALAAGIKHAYTGNVHDAATQSTYCAGCGGLLIGRDWHALGAYNLAGGRCAACGRPAAGVFDAAGPGTWGRKRARVDMSRFASLARERPREDPPAMTAGPAAAPAALTPEEEAAVLLAAGEYVRAASAGVSPEAARVNLANLAGRPVHGVYVSLKRKGRLRGCCGSFGRETPLPAAVQQSAARTALEDPRFPPVSPAELPYLEQEVWILGPGEAVAERGADRVNAVAVGRHGLIVERDDKRGLLLPGVATENGWDAEEFLNQVCIKAQLPPTAWREPATRLMRFGGSACRGPLLPQGGGPSDVTALFDDQQMRTYVQFYAQAIGAILENRTPMLYLAAVPDANVSGVILTLRAVKSGREVTVSRFEARSFVPLQASLGNLCQAVAQAILRQRLEGPFSLDMALAYSPALHGSVAEPDLGGLDPARRGLMVAERAKTSWLYDPSLTPEDLLARAAEQCEAREPSAAMLISFRAQSTRRPVGLRSVPAARLGGEVRVASAAGKFYPADAENVQQMLDAMLSTPGPGRRRCSAVMVPHAGWAYSGKLAAAALRRVDFPKTVIALGPKHTPHGVEWAVAPHRTWQLPGGDVQSDIVLARKLAEAVGDLKLDAGAHREEHAVEVELPIIRRLAPGTKVLGVAVAGGGLDRCEAFAEGLAELMARLDEMPLLLISTDMNHYATDEQTRPLDEMALAEIDRLDPDGLFDVVTRNHISMCGVLPAVIAMKALKKVGRLNRCERVGYATSSDSGGDKARVVGYAGVVFN